MPTITNPSFNKQPLHNTEPRVDQALVTAESEMTSNNSPSEAVRAASEICKSTSAKSQDDMNELRAEVDRLKTANEELERRLLLASSTAAKETNDDEESRQLDLKKSIRGVQDLKLLAASTEAESTESSSRRTSPPARRHHHRRTADRDKAERLEAHLLETQRRSQEAQSMLESKLDRALEANRVLRVENSRCLDEMHDRIEDLTANVETEEWCHAAMEWLQEDFRKSGRRDRMTLLRSRSDRMMRERDEHIRVLEEACERKDRAIDTLRAELRGVKEEAKGLRLAEAARLAPSALPGNSKTVEIHGSKTSRPASQSGGGGAVPIPQETLRRNCPGHATCA